MFICSKKNLEIREGGQTISIPAGFIGEIPAWVENHWYVKAALKDGTISAPQSRRDADVERKKKTEQ